MVIKVHAIDGYKNISENGLYMFANAVNSFSKDCINYYSQFNISVGQAFHRYVSPLRSSSDFAHRYSFNKRNIEIPQLTVSGREQAPAITTYTRSIGLIFEDSSKFELSPLGRLLYNRSLTVEEYSFVLLSKQGVFVDDVYKGKLLTFLSEYFVENNQITKEDFYQYLEKRLANGSTATFSGRADILFNAIQVSGLITIVDKDVFIITPSAERLLKDFIVYKDKLSITPINNNDYYLYAGRIDNGVFEILDKETVEHYVDIYPNIYNHFADAGLSSRRIYEPLNLPLQQIYYGAPGTGKSHEINEQTEGEEVIRTTFHPDSDYSTFVGAYKPTSKEIVLRDDRGLPVKENGELVMENRIIYEFVEQAFLQTYIKAWKNYCNASNIAKTVSPSLKPNGKGTTGKYMVFQYTPKSSRLSPNEENELLNVDNFSFPFIGYGNLGDLHNDGITVVSTDKPTQEQLKHFERRFDLQKIREELQDIESHMGDNQELRLKYNTLSQISFELFENNGVVRMDNLLGLYDPNEKTIFLFMDNIGHDNIPLLCAVYVHEMYHAYFHSNTGFKTKYYVPEVEEPIAESSTLRFLDVYNKGYYSTYESNVQSKKYTAFGYYGFGDFLNGVKKIDWANLYYNYYRVTTPNQSVTAYCDKFNPVYPFGDEKDTMSLLQILLQPNSYSVTDTCIKPIYLIIEEINRGNCAQIFGDIFQLLDRNDWGFSEYPIKADNDMKMHLKKAFAGLSVAKADEINALYNGKDIVSQVLDGDILLLPNNMYIWATMNTSDQSLFPIDSAFKRRWDWCYMPIDTEKESWAIRVNGTDYSWASFLDIINEIVHDKTQSEDKQLGFYFCKAKNKVIDAEMFVGKVLFYLWNDVFKDYGFDDDFFEDEKLEDGSIKPLSFKSFYDVKTRKVIENQAEKFLKNLGIEVMGGKPVDPTGTSTTDLE